jgi:RNA polymerase sigma-70 factor (ECF subfamily)
VLVEKMPEFQYDRGKSFRAWLRTVTMNKWRDRCRRQAAGPKQIATADTDGFTVAEPAWWDESEYRGQLVGRALAVLQGEFQQGTWSAFWECAVVGRSGREVADELGISVNAVYLARSRVMRRLREELTGLLD